LRSNYDFSMWSRQLLRDLQLEFAVMTHRLFVAQILS
jgi:hypothetical protein